MPTEYLPITHGKLKELYIFLFNFPIELSEFPLSEGYISADAYPLAAENLSIAVAIHVRSLKCKVFATFGISLALIIAYLLKYCIVKFVQGHLDKVDRIKCFNAHITRPSRLFIPHTKKQQEPYELLSLACESV